MIRFENLRTSQARASIAAACLLSAATLVVSGCAGESSETSTPSATASDLPSSLAPIGTAEPMITDDQMVFVDELLADPLTLDEATAMIEAAGYTWRIGEIDGEGRPLTTDYVVDRLTLIVQDGTVVRAVWG